MEQLSSQARTSRKYFYFFIVLVSLIVLTDLAGGVSSRAVDPKRSAAEAKEKRQREDYQTLFYDSPTASPQTATSKASDSPAQQSKINPISPLMTFTNSSPTATTTNGTNLTAASPYPSTITVPGSFTGTVSTISVVLHSVVTDGNQRSSLCFAGLVLVSPSGKSMEIFGNMNGDCTDGGGLNLPTLTFQDGNSAALPPNNGTAISPNNTAKNWKPSSFGVGSFGEPHSYITIGTPQFFATTHGSATMSSVFVGETAAGTWKLYLEDFGGDPVSFSSWDLNLTAVAASGTTTTVTSNLNPSFTSGANSSVTLTATVSSGTNGQPTGTVAFTDNGASIGCDSQALAGAGANSSTATCVHTFATEGNRPIVATYTATGSFAGSTSTTFTQIARNHSTNPSTLKYCNGGSLVATGIPGTQFIYPSYLEVPALANTVANVSVSLNGMSGPSGINVGQLLLVSPDGHTLDFLSHVNFTVNQPSVNGTIADNNPSAPINGQYANNFIYEPTDAHNTTDVFGQPPSPNPQVPGTFNQAQPTTPSMTLAQAFNGATGQGDWLLYLYDNGGSGSAITLSGGWCLTFTLNTGNPSTTTITSNNNPARTGVPVTFTATVKDGALNPITSGTVTFTENGSPPAGTVSGNNVVTVNGSGQATFTTSSLSEGDHTILATFNSASFNSSNQSVIQREDNTPTVSLPGANAYTYCNTGAVLIPAGSGGPFNLGQANPNPSNVFVTNLPGTINSVGVTLKSFATSSTQISFISSLLVGPGATNANTLSFFSQTGASNTILASGDYTFVDSASGLVPQSAFGPGSYKPTSYNAGTGSDTYFSTPSGFFTLPAGPYQFAATRGAQTFNGTYQNGSNGIGTWSLYFNQNIHADNSGPANGWCVNFVENPPVMAITSSHSGSFRQGDTADTYTVHVTNNGPGPTGDPTGTVPVKVIAIPPAGLTVTGMSGTGWTCTTLPNCTRSDAINSGSSYPDITVTVSVGCNAAASVNNNASVQGGGASGIVTSANDATTIDQLAANGSGTLTVSPTTALAGASGQNYTFTYTAVAGGLNGGEIDITIPAGWSGGSATTNNGSATIVSGVIKVTGITTPSTAGSVVTIGYNGATVGTTIGANAFNTKEESASTGSCALTALGSSPAVAVTNTDTWTGGTSTDWNTGGNWDFAVVPGTLNDVAIPNVGAQPALSTNPTVNSLNISSGRMLTMTGHTLTISGTAAGSDLTFNGGGVINGGALQFSGAGPHVIFNTTGTGSISATNTTTVLSGASVTLSSVLGNDLQMGALAINSGGSFSVNGRTLSLNGPGAALTVGGTFTGAPNGDGANPGAPPGDGPQSVGGTVVYNSTTGAQTAAGVTYFGLTINNSAGVTLTGNAMVNGVLTLTSGDLGTGAFTLTMPNTASSGPASNATDVVGNVKRTGFIAGSNTLSFGNPFNTIKINSGAVPTDITMNLVKTSPANFSQSVQRTYTITETGSNGPATLRLHYLDSELNNNTPESGLNLRRFNGTGWAPVAATASNTADATNNWLENNNVPSFSQWTFSNFSPTAANGSVSGRITTSNGNPVEGAVINLSGDQTRKTITDANGNYHFNEVGVNGFYTVTPSRVNYNFTPFNRSFNLIGNTADAAFGAISTGDNRNPLDTPEYFVRQQYVDILGREPDEGGFNYWSDQINQCNGDPDCIRSKRVDVAAAFFVEAEFQQTGSFIYDLYSGALGRRPMFNEYSTDRKQVLGGPNLDAEKAAFAQSFVQRAEFTTKYQGAMTAGSFVDALIQNVQQVSGVDLSSQRDALIDHYNTGTDTNQSRSFVISDLAANSAFNQAQYNPAFVLTEYFGYLQRNPDQGGYDFWLNVINDREVGNYRGMVCAFITSTEYQQRFSSVVSHGNGECGP